MLVYASNLSYVFSTAVYGIVTTFVAAKLGHNSLFDGPPVNDYIKPTETTTEQAPGIVFFGRRWH